MINRITFQKEYNLQYTYNVLLRFIAQDKIIKLIEDNQGIYLSVEEGISPIISGDEKERYSLLENALHGFYNYCIDTCKCVLMGMSNNYELHPSTVEDEVYNLLSGKYLIDSTINNYSNRYIYFRPYLMGNNILIQDGPFVVESISNHNVNRGFSNSRTSYHSYSQVVGANKARLDSQANYRYREGICKDCVYLFGNIVGESYLHCTNHPEGLKEENCHDKI